MNCGAAVEPGIFNRKPSVATDRSIGHLKAEHRSARNHFKGREGDRINAALSASFNVPTAALVRTVFARPDALRLRPRNTLKSAGDNLQDRPNSKLRAETPRVLVNC
jgi:hypothetical protein